MNQYRVIDIQTETIDPKPRTVPASSPEKPAEIVLGTVLVRSGAPDDLRAKVYFQGAGQPMTMVRLYSKASERRR